MVVFEIARWHRFAADMAAVPDNVTVHVLPTGDPEPPKYADLSTLRYRDTSRVAERIQQAQQSAAAYLAGR
jgi:NTE family protein